MVATSAIRDTIHLAKCHEEEHHHLEKLLEIQIANREHSALQLPSEKPVAALMSFVIAYIERVPDILDATRNISQNTGIEDFAETYLRVAEDYFLKPQEITAKHIGLHELMDEAYLAHRLIEEVNDRFLLHSSTPLIPIDMTISNLIIHSLIGEPFANELDEAVDYTVEITQQQGSASHKVAFATYANKNQALKWQEGLKRWPSLSKELPIGLQLAGFN